MKPALGGLGVGMTNTMWAALLAPLIGGVFYWLVTRPGKWAHDWLWRKLPDGKLRDILLKKVD